MPGNYMLAEEEEKKLSRKNRYGLHGDNKYTEGVEIQRKKLGLDEKPKSVKLDDKSKKKVKDHLKG